MTRRTEHTLRTALLGLSICGVVAAGGCGGAATGPAAPGASAVPPARAKRVPPAPGPPPAAAADGIPHSPLWHLTAGNIPPGRGTGGLDPTGRAPAGVFLANVPPHGYIPPTDVYHRGLYFIGAGRILPETALRIDSKEQLVVVRMDDGTSALHEHWSGPADLSALAWLVRTDQGLLLTILVTDDKFVTIPDKTHKKDSVELYFDVRPAMMGMNRYERGVFQMVLSPDKKAGRLDVSYGQGQAPVPGVKTRCTFRGDGYDLKVFIPFAGLKAAHYVPGNRFHFDIGINDSDRPGVRETQMIWAGSSVNFMDARLFGRMRSVRRGYYFTEAFTYPKPPAPPRQAVLHMDTAFHVRAGKKRQWKGPSDCSGRAWLCRSPDDSAFLLSVDVTDDVLRTDQELAFKNDSVEVYFDLRPAEDRGKAEYAKGVFQMIVVPNAKGGAATISFPDKAAAVPGVKAHTTVKKNGYRLAILIPFDGLKKAHRLPGRRFNFDVGINDCDSPAGRHLMLEWAGFHNNFRNAASWGRMEPAPKPNRASPESASTTETQRPQSL